MKWNSAALLASPLMLAFVLGGCGSSESAAPPPQPATTAATDLPVMGDELRIVALGVEVFDEGTDFSPFAKANSV